MLICLMPQAACDSINAEGGNEQESDCLWRRWINDVACQKVTAATAPVDVSLNVRVHGHVTLTQGEARDRRAQPLLIGLASNALPSTVL